MLFGLHQTFLRNENASAVILLPTPDKNRDSDETRENSSKYLRLIIFLILKIEVKDKPNKHYFLLNESVLSIILS